MRSWIVTQASRPTIIGEIHDAPFPSFAAYRVAEDHYGNAPIVTQSTPTVDLYPPFWKYTVSVDSPSGVYGVGEFVLLEVKTDLDVLVADKKVHATPNPTA